VEFKHRLAGNIVFLSGTLDENVNFPPILEQVESLRGICLIDLEKVDKINSYGTRLWVSFIHSITIPKRLRNCSVAITELFSHLPEAHQGCKIESVFAIYFCLSCDHYFSHKVRPDIDFEDDDFTTVPQSRCPVCGHDADFCGEEGFFSFFQPPAKISGMDVMPNINGWQTRKSMVTKVDIMALNSGEIIAQGTSKNICEGGLFICLEHPLPVASKIVVCFSTPRSDISHKIFAEVKWCRTRGDAKGIGIQFLHPEEQVIDRIKRYLVSEILV